MQQKKEREEKERREREKRKRDEKEREREREKDEAVDYFTTTYQAEAKRYTKPSWMPDPPSPSVTLDLDDIKEWEIQQVIKNQNPNHLLLHLTGCPTRYLSTVLH